MRFTHIGKRGQKRRAEGIYKPGGRKLCEQHKIFAAGRKAGHGVRHKGRARVDKPPVLQHIAPGQGAFALAEQVCHHGQQALVAFGVVLEHHHLCVRAKRGVHVLQKQFFLCGGGVKGKVYPGDAAACKGAAPVQLAHGLFQPQAAARSLRPRNEKGAARALCGCAHYKVALQRHAQSFAVFRLAQHSAAQLFLQAVKGLGPGARHTRGGRAFARAARKVLHGRGVHLAPDACNVLQGALVHGLQLCALCGGRFVQKFAHVPHAFLQGVHSLCTLPKGAARRAAVCRLGRALLARTRLFGRSFLRRRRRFLCGPPARGRCGLRLQRELRLCLRRRAAAKGAVQQFVNVVFHGAFPSAAQWPRALCRPVRRVCSKLPHSGRKSRRAFWRKGRFVAIIPHCENLRTAF